jgi:hypothetical protein
MLLAYVTDKALAILLDEGAKLLFAAWELVSTESIQLESNFGVFLIFSTRLRASAFKVVGAL